MCIDKEQTELNLKEFKYMFNAFTATNLRDKTYTKIINEIKNVTKALDETEKERSK